MTNEEISNELVRIKDEGNVEFKAKNYLAAAEKFTEGTSLYLKNE